MTTYTWAIQTSCPSFRRRPSGGNPRTIGYVPELRTSRSRCTEGAIPPCHTRPPLPAETREAAAFIRDTSPGAIIKLWDAHLTALDDLAQGCKLAQSKWDACIPEEISPAAGKFQTVSMKQLTNQLGMGGSTWLGQFAYGFPITGQLS